MTSVQTTPNGDPIARMTSRTTDAQTQTDAPVQPRQQPISDTLKAAQNRQSYRPPHQLNSPDATHAGSAALLAAQHTTSPTAWTYDGSAGASAAASLAKANSKPIEAWKPDKLSSAGAAASLAHRASISERTTPVHKNDGTASASGASAALRSPKQSFESYEPDKLAISSAEASLTNSSQHAMKAASKAHKPSISSKQPTNDKQSKTSASHALRAASAADSTIQKVPSPPSTSRSLDESARIQSLAQKLAKQDIERGAYVSGGVGKSGLARAASISMAKKQATDQAEQAQVAAHKRAVEEEAQQEWSSQQEVDDAARRIVAERLARLTLTGDEGDEVLAGKAAGDAVMRGNERVRDWERVLKSLDDEDKEDKQKNVSWLRASMRKSTTFEKGTSDPTLVMEAARRNVKSQLDEIDKSVAQEQLLMGKPSGENLVKRDSAIKEQETKGATELERKQKERASTYDIGGMIMTRDQVEAIAQKHVNEVLAEINEKVEREKERIEMERIERETKLREKQHEKELARERAAEEKAEKEKIKAEQKEQKAEEKRLKDEAKAAEKKRKADEKQAQKDLKTVQKEQLGTGEGLVQYDAQKDKEAEIAERKEAVAKNIALNKAEGEQMAAVGGVIEYDQQKDRQEAVIQAAKDAQAERELETAEGEQRGAVGGVIEFDQQKEVEDFRKGVEERVQANRELAEAGAEQRAAVGGVIEFDQQKDHEALRKSIDQKVQANKELAQAQAEQANAAEVVLNPDTALDDDKKGGVRVLSWFRDKGSKLGKRLSRLGSPDTESRNKSTAVGNNKDEDDDDEDLYGEQLTPAIDRDAVMRDDSLRKVALAQADEPPEEAEVHEAEKSEEEKEAEHVDEAYAIPDSQEIDESGAKEGEEEGEEEEFDDAPEEIKDEVPEPASSSLTPKDEAGGMRKVSSEKGSFFKEEF